MPGCRTIPPASKCPIGKRSKTLLQALLLFLRQSAHSHILLLISPIVQAPSQSDMDASAFVWQPGNADTSRRTASIRPMIVFRLRIIKTSFQYKSGIDRLRGGCPSVFLSCKWQMRSQSKQNNPMLFMQVMPSRFEVEAQRESAHCLFYHTISPHIKVLLQITIQQNINNRCFGLWHYEGMKRGSIPCSLIDGRIIGRFPAFREKHPAL